MLLEGETNNVRSGGTFVRLDMNGGTIEVTWNPARNHRRGKKTHKNAPSIRDTTSEGNGPLFISCFKRGILMKWNNIRNLFYHQTFPQM